MVSIHDVANDLTVDIDELRKFAHTNLGWNAWLAAHITSLTQEESDDLTNAWLSH